MDLVALANPDSRRLDRVTSARTLRRMRVRPGIDGDEVMIVARRVYRPGTASGLRLTGIHAPRPGRAIHHEAGWLTLPAEAPSAAQSCWGANRHPCLPPPQTCIAPFTCGLHPASLNFHGAELG